MADLLPNTTESLAGLTFQDISFGTVLYVAYVIILAYIVVFISSFLLRKLSERLPTYRHPVTMLIPLVKIFVYFLAFYYIIIAFIQPNLTQLVAFFGLFGAALGLGLKDLFADIIGGIVIIIEKPYQIGDKITIGEYYGEVTDIGIRSTKLVTPGDSVVSAPNYLIFSQSVSSANAGNISMMVIIDLFIDSRCESGTALKILKEAVISSKFVFVSEKFPFTVLVDDFPFYHRIRAKAYVNDLRDEFEFKSEVTRKAWIEFRKHGIRPPRMRDAIPEQGTLTAPPS
ncbi:MAG: mechanosensitive ion channel [Methanomicrobiales archaeon]|nr:mechanosensitive ion channel [Methanomicrobiales archaeon]NYT21238.1 mechanosensitive ion channel [Methanomicrobiales archaeon]